MLLCMKWLLVYLFLLKICFLKLVVGSLEILPSIGHIMTHEVFFPIASVLCLNGFSSHTPGRRKFGHCQTVIGIGFYDCHVANLNL